MQRFTSILWADLGERSDGGGDRSDVELVVSADARRDLGLDRIRVALGFGASEATGKVSGASEAMGKVSGASEATRVSGATGKVSAASAAFDRPIRDRELLDYRQRVFADLQREEIRAPAAAFVLGMRDVRRLGERADGLTHPIRRAGYRLAAARRYLDVLRAVRSAPAVERSPGLSAWRDHVAGLLDAPRGRAFEADVRAAEAALAAARYTVRIDGRELSVERDRAEPDYAATVAATFARLGVRPSPPAAVEPEEPTQMEERLLDRVAELYRDEFARLAEFADRYADPVDPVVRTFDREIRFYLRYLALVKHHTEAGRAFCLPRFTTQGERSDGMDSAEVNLVDGFDASLLDAETIVPNSLRLAGDERIVVVTGPNQGGKTTFARMLGQLAYLAALGAPVPARSAWLPLPDLLGTHFPRRDDAADPDGTLLDELHRMRELLGRATESSLLVLNESFAATTATDGTRIGAEVLDRLTRLGTRVVFVTFLDELAGRPDVVSLRAGTDPDDPDLRTFRVERAAAGGAALAESLAARHGLGYADIVDRVRG